MLLFTSPGCAPCENIKKRYAGFTTVDISTEDGASLAVLHRVRQVPTLVVQGEVYVGAINIDRFFNNATV